MNPKTFFAELKRRNVYKVAVAYIVAGWALSQGIAQVFPFFEIPNWAIRLVIMRADTGKNQARGSCGRNEAAIARLCQR